MSSGDLAVENTQARNEGNNKRMSCQLYGCKRAYPDASALQSHIKDHELPVQSLPGKTMMCSTVGCGGTFPNMQKLMEHMRHHYKPNIYFLCESCHAKLRSYRGLLVHLRTCSKAARPKVNPSPSPSTSTSSTVAATATAATGAAEPPVPMDVDNVQTTAPPQDTLSSPPPPQLPPIAPLSNLPPLLAPNQDLTPPDLMQQVIDSTVNAIFSKDRQPVSPTPSPEVQPGSSTNERQVQQQRPNTPEASGPPKLTPQTLPTNAWRSGQGPNPEKRVLWQHTRGRYTCLQCGFTVTNRKDMTEHSAVHSDSISTKEEPPSPATTSA